jgi:hypothetical protein
MRKNTGKSAEQKFEALMKQQGAHVFRLRDSKDVNGLNKTKGGKRLAMFPCPADFLVAERDGMSLVEVKSTWNKDRFDYGDIRPAQRSAACICASLGSPYSFYIYSMELEKWFFLTAEVFADDLKAGKKSRKFEDMLCLPM